MKQNLPNNKQSFRQDELIFRQNTTGDYQAFLILSGEAELFYDDEMGNKNHIAYLGPRQVIGDAALINQAPYPISARATSATECMVLDIENLGTILQNENPFIAALMKLIVSRYRSLLEDYAEEQENESPPQ